MATFLRSLTLFSILSLLPYNLSAREILTQQARRDYQSRLLKQPQLAELLKIDSSLTPDEKDALTYLYAYLPTPDIVNYEPQFILENTRLALQAAEEMPWGASVPDREWRHFVLPVRVNNEAPDHSRNVFYEELKERVKGMSMKDAILEVNHWCHEKVSYQPSDPRTSSPLATVKNALGRCGEESTFTVAALRSIGIPARQVYTPRWAHTDDNHAWVEAWADGQWYFLGACEPEPELNIAWFNLPASRGMLMTTHTLGDYDGPEEILDSNTISKFINVTPNYTPTATSTVYILDSEGHPVENAEVRFCLYNYAELYPLTSKKTDKSGKAQFLSGLGDLLIWASDGKNFNLSKLNAGDTLKLTLDKTSDLISTMDFDLVPPVAGGEIPKVSEQQIAINNQRKTYEDSIRLNYISSFFTTETASDFCRQHNQDLNLAEILVNSRGNHEVITSFILSLPDSLYQKGYLLLTSLTEKDLHDVTPEILEDHLHNSPAPSSDLDLYCRYIINPRIEFEHLAPYRAFIISSLSEQQIESFRANPSLISDYINLQIADDSLYNPEELYQSPISTLKYPIATRVNKELAFVAICRSLGIPARINSVDGAVQYVASSGSWKDIDFAPESSDYKAEGATGSLIIVDKGSLNGRAPKYYSNFTLSRMYRGLPQLLEFDDFIDVDSLNSQRHQFAPGQYAMLTGQRLADGTVKTRLRFFPVLPDADNKVKLEVRQDSTALQVIGNLDAELLFTPVKFHNGRISHLPAQSILSTTGRGYYVMGFILPGHEPSSHVLNDLAESRSELSTTGKKILLLFPDAESASGFRIEDYGLLPDNVIFGIDDGSIAKAIQDDLELAEPISKDLPTFIIADTFNRIIYHNRGYSIRFGETLTRLLDSL